MHIQSDGCHHRTGGLVVELSQPNIMVKTEIGKINLIVFIIYNLKGKNIYQDVRKNDTDVLVKRSNNLVKYTNVIKRR